MSRFNRPLSLSRRQSGVALLTVMFIMALMTTLIAYMVEDQHLTIRRAQFSMDAERAFQAALAGEQWAIAVLKEDLKKDIHQDKVRGLPQNDHLKEEWYEVEKPTIDLDLELGQSQSSKKSAKDDSLIKVKIVDESALFNLNNLYIPQTQIDASSGGQNSPGIYWKIAFEHLLESLDIDAEKANGLLHWLDPDNQSTGGQYSAEDDDYLLLDTPYRAANRLMEDVGELALIKGFEEEDIEKLKPYITALPSYGAKINANTCDQRLLEMLYTAGGNAWIPIGEETASQIVEMRTDNGIEEFQTQVVDMLGNNLNVIEAKRFLDEKSTYFRIVTQVNVGRVNYGIETLVKRINLQEIEITNPDELRRINAAAQAAGGGKLDAYVKILKRRRIIS